MFSYMKTFSIILFNSMKLSMHKVKCHHIVPKTLSIFREAVTGDDL